MLALIIYCFVAIAVAAFAPWNDQTTDSDNNGLIDDEKESSRYDFTSRTMNHLDCMK